MIRHSDLNFRTKIGTFLSCLFRFWYEIRLDSNPDLSSTDCTGVPHSLSQVHCRRQSWQSTQPFRCSQQTDWLGIIPSLFPPEHELLGPTESVNSMCPISPCRTPTTWQRCRCLSKPAQPIPSTRRSSHGSGRAPWGPSPGRQRGPQEPRGARSSGGRCRRCWGRPSAATRPGRRTRCASSAPRAPAPAPAASAPSAPSGWATAAPARTSTSGDPSSRNWGSCTRTEKQETCSSPRLLFSVLEAQVRQSFLYRRSIIPPSGLFNLLQQGFRFPLRHTWQLVENLSRS